MPAPHLLGNKLVQVLPDHVPETMGIHAVYLSRQHQSPLLRLMVDHLANSFSEQVLPWGRRHVRDAEHIE